MMQESLRFVPDVTPHDVTWVTTATYKCAKTARFTATSTTRAYPTYVRCSTGHRLFDVHAIRIKAVQECTLTLTNGTS